MLDFIYNKCLYFHFIYHRDIPPLCMEKALCKRYMPHLQIFFNIYDNCIHMVIDQGSFNNVLYIALCPYRYQIYFFAL